MYDNKIEPCTLYKPSKIKHSGNKFNSKAKQLTSNVDNKNRLNFRIRFFKCVLCKTNLFVPILPVAKFKKNNGFRRRITFNISDIRSLTATLKNMSIFFNDYIC